MPEPFGSLVDVLGVRVDDVTHAEALARCRTLIEDPQPRYCVTPNPEFVILARRDPEFRRILNAADLAIPDGGGLLLASRLWGTPLREQVRGTDLCYLLMEEGTRQSWRFFLLGAAPGVADEAAERLRRRYPGLQIAGTFAGDGSPAGDAETRNAVRAAGRCDVLFVCYGANKQERWIDRNLSHLDVGLALGLGGVLDFFSGRVRRAPSLVRRLGVDWAWRAIVQPSRVRRQADTIPRFLWLAAREALRRRGLRIA
jgi:N-acetylglucosaminyldiphosphoundecaprenol N-acetyl-beta-D-mannosaminyltransferase